MKIAVLGAGGVGGYFGARLAAAGHDVGFIARGAHLGAMRRDGLRILSPLGDLTLNPLRASDSAAGLRADFGVPDLVMFCVKLYDVESAANGLKPLLGPETCVLALQNGVDAEGRLAKTVGAEKVTGGVAYISSTIEAPGLIRHFNRAAKLSFGEMDGSLSPRLQRFHAACADAGFDAELVPDIERALWEKFVFLASFAGLTSLTRKPIGPILADADVKALLTDAFREAMAVAAARGVTLPPSLLPRQLAALASVDPEMRASMARDLENGNRIEIEGLSGALVRLGVAAGVPTPVHRAIYAGLKLHAGGAGR